MRSGFLVVACVCAIVACTDDIGLPTGTADLAFEGNGSATVAWATARAAGGWSLYFGSDGSACGDGETALAQIDLWQRAGSSSTLPAGVYHQGCGSDGLCNATFVGADAIDFAEVDLLAADASHLSGSLEGSATTGSETTIEFYGAFDAQVCE